MSEATTVRVMFIRDSSPLAGAPVRIEEGGTLRTDADGVVAISTSNTHVNLSVGHGDRWYHHRLTVGDAGGLVVLDVLRSRTTDGMLDTERVNLGERYRFVALLGRGGMGVVIRADDTVLGRPVAIKMLNAELQSNPEARDVLLTEGKALARLSHPNLVKIYDVAQLDGRVIVVLEYVEGTTLQSFVDADPPLPHDEVVDLALQLTAALRYLHEEGVVHRDIKPANLIRQPDGLLRLIDFGLARSVEHLVQRGTRVRGSPAYMAPEQVEGRKLTPATDVYQFGVTLFEVLTGRLPFTSGDFAYAHVHRQPPSIAEFGPDLSPRLAHLIDRCLAKPPQARPSVDELTDELRTIAAEEASGHTTTLGAPLDVEPYVAEDPPPNRRWPVALIALVLSSAVLAGWYATSRAEEEPTPSAPVSVPTPVSAPTDETAPDPPAVNALPEARSSVRLAVGLATSLSSGPPRAAARPAPARREPRRARARERVEPVEPAEMVDATPAAEPPKPSVEPPEPAPSNEVVEPEPPADTVQKPAESPPREVPLLPSPAPMPAKVEKKKDSPRELTSTDKAASPEESSETKSDDDGDEPDVPFGF